MKLQKSILAGLTLLNTIMLEAHAISIIEPMSIEQEQGFKGQINASFSFENGDTDSTTMEGDINASQGKENYLNYGILSTSYEENNQKKTANKSFVHVRHIRQVFESKTTNVEFFGQIGRDEIKALKQRDLYGLGMRKDFLFENHGAFFIGGGIFRFTEKRIGQVDDDGERFNLYISFKQTLRENIKFLMVSYFQPRVNRGEDFDTVLQSQLKFKITDRMHLKLEASYSHQERPVPGKKRDNSAMMTGLGYHF